MTFQIEVGEWGGQLDAVIVTIHTARHATLLLGLGGRTNIRKLAICTMHVEIAFVYVRLDWNFHGI